MKQSFRSVFNWVCGIFIANLGICFCTKANFGLSMIGASPYILHVYLRDTFEWFTQGTAEYVWEAIILVVACIIVRRFEKRYLLSFLTALLTGFIIDGWFLLLHGNAPYESMVARVAAFVFGTCLTSLGIAFVFNSTMPMQVYELLVAEVSKKYNKDLNKVKFVNDITLLLVAIALSFCLTGKLTGIGVGTVVITFANAPLIKLFRKIVEKVESM